MLNRTWVIYLVLRDLVGELEKETNTKFLCVSCASHVFYPSDSVFQMSKLGFREILQSCLSPKLMSAVEISFDCKAGSLFV